MTVEAVAVTYLDNDSVTQRSKASRRRTWLSVIVAVVVVTGLIVVAAFTILTRNPSPDAFYDPPSDMGAPGTIIRSEPFSTGVPAGSTGWRILYASTDPQGRPVAVSGLVIVPQTVAAAHPVLAWSHGTTGIARPCAPSLSDDPLAGIPDMTGPLSEGWVIVLTDYPGLGTPSPHPYLVGESEGRAVLDSVRAAHQLDLGLTLDDRYAIWGHSQGGQSALFAGQMAHEYLPEYPLVAVAALAPATRLQQNLAAMEGTQAGNVLTILAVESWTAYYSDIPADTLTAAARGPAAKIAASCLNQPSRFRMLLAGLSLPDQVVAIDPATDPTWAKHLEDNTPAPGGITAPLFVGQGDADEIIDPDVTRAWTADRCGAGLPTTWRTYPGLDHTGVVEPGGHDAFNWTIDRFAGKAAATACPTEGESASPRL
jgi:acetyl esterase/lipase